MVCKLKKILVKIFRSNLQSFLLKQIISIFHVGIFKFEKKKVSSSWTSKFIRRRIQLYVKNVRCRISLLALKLLGSWSWLLLRTAYRLASQKCSHKFVKELLSLSFKTLIKLGWQFNKNFNYVFSLGRISTNGLPEIKIIKSWG